MNRPAQGTEETRQIDVNPLLSLRLVDATAPDVRAVEAQVGLSAKPLTHEDGRPAITLRYVDRLPAGGEAAWGVGPHDLHWTREGVTLAAGRSGRRALIPFEQLGGDIELSCERGIGRIPHLIAILNLTALSRGVPALHASSFLLSGNGCAAAGWSQSGKTEALLSAMTRTSSQMASDEWTYLTGDHQAHGLPTPIRLEPWHLRSTGVRRLASAALDARTVTALRAADRLETAVPARLKSLAPARLIRRAVHKALPLRHVDIAPAMLFGAERVIPKLQLKRIYWLAPLHSRVANGRPRVEQADSPAFISRMATSHVHHRMAFLDAYWRFRYAFPDRRSHAVEEMEEREREALGQTLGGVRIFRLEHPPRVDFARLLEAMESAVD